MDEMNRTPFTAIYDSFYSRVTDEMYMEMTELDTLEQLQGILLNAIPRFEFPRFDPFDYEEGEFVYLGEYQGVESGGLKVPVTGWVGGFFNTKLTQEEINILSLSMLIEWFTQQLATTENTRQIYTGADFKMTSQANHMAKLKVMINEYQKECFHHQRLYKRRKIVNGEVHSTIGQIMATPGYGYSKRRGNKGVYQI